MPMIQTNEGQFLFEDFDNLYTERYCVPDDELTNDIFFAYVCATSKNTEELLNNGYISLGVSEMRGEFVGIPMRIRHWYFLKNEKPIFIPKENVEKYNLYD